MSVTCSGFTETLSPWFSKASVVSTFLKEKPGNLGMSLLLGLDLLMFLKLHSMDGGDLDQSRQTNKQTYKKISSKAFDEDKQKNLVTVE